jgi:glycosyltransferase involved in cell wall biosynthesis
MSRPLISILVPVLNEAGNILPLYEALERVMSQVSDRYDFELLFTDNHSDDRTFPILEELARQDDRIRVYRFSRNFGFQQSILTGYLNARGDAVVQIDCDLQDPPELILKFIEAWQQGYQVVYGVRRSRQEAWLLNKARGLFYSLVDLLSECPLPHHAGDFRLVARPLIEEIRRMDDPAPYLRGAIASLGFDQTGVPYDRHERQRGSSKFNFRSLAALAVDGILSTSIIPLRVATFAGLIISFLTVCAIAVYAVLALFYGKGWPSGFATITLLLLLGISVNSLFLGILGEYLGRIYKQSKKQPISIVQYSIENGVVVHHAAPPKPLSTESQSSSSGEPQ